MVPMGLIRRIPMASRSHEWVIWISHIAYTIHMDMEPMRPYRGLCCSRRLIFRQPDNLGTDPGPANCIPKKYNSAYLRPKRPAHYISNRRQVLTVMHIVIHFKHPPKTYLCIPLPVYEHRYLNEMKSEK
jgi:hypothetical protein